MGDSKQQGEKFTRYTEELCELINKIFFNTENGNRLREILQEKINSAHLLNDCHPGCNNSVHQTFFCAGYEEALKEIVFKINKYYLVKKGIEG